MKAIVKTRREPGVEVLDVAMPPAGKIDILVKVVSGSLCGSDLHVYEWTTGYDFVRVPRILGHEFSGEVAVAGPEVESVRVGDRITAMPTMPCGQCAACRVGKGDRCTERIYAGLWSDGFFAEYGRLTAGADVFKLPDTVSFDAASLLEPLAVALNGVDLSNIKIGNSVAVLGPGPIGLLLVKLLKLAGAGSILAVGTPADAQRLDLARRYGADSTVEVGKEDPVSASRTLGGSRSGLDMVFEATGNPKSIPQALEMVRPGGKVLLVGIHSGPAQFDPTPMVRGRKSLLGVYGYDVQTWRRGLALLASGRLEVESMITHRLPLDRAVEGFELARTKQAVKVVFKP